MVEGATDDPAVLADVQHARRARDESGHAHGPHGYASLVYVSCLSRVCLLGLPSESCAMERICLRLRRLHRHYAHDEEAPMVLMGTFSTLEQSVCIAMHTRAQRA